MQVLALASQIVERSNDGLATSLAAERIKAREAVEKFVVVFVFSLSHVCSTCVISLVPQVSGIAMTIKSTVDLSDRPCQESFLIFPATHSDAHELFMPANVSRTIGTTG